jgi:uncharacterized protein (DUF1684 family)
LRTGSLRTPPDAQEETVTVSDTDTFAQDWEAWHAGIERARADRHGFLAITGLSWLTTEPQPVPGAPGVWRTGEDGVVVDLGPGEEVEVDGRPVTGRHAFGRIPERGGVTVGAGDGVIEIARRGGADLVRPRHPNSRVLRAYRGTPTFAADPRWVVPGRYVPFDEPRPTTVGAVVEGLQHVYDALGTIAFELGAQQLSLTAFGGATPGSLFILFTDVTSGVTTYPANRSLQVAAPDAEGRVVLDFNRATNLPCAYTDFATCPLPPAENRLPVAVEAGEKKPLDPS